MMSTICVICYLLVLILSDARGWAFKSSSPGRYWRMSTVTSNAHSSVSAKDRILAFRGLQSNMFAHPVDMKVTSQLEKLPIIENIARSVFNTLEQALVVENLGSSILVGQAQMPQLYNTLAKAAKILDMEAPDLYIKQNPLPNAYTLAYKGKKPFIVMHTGLLDLLNEDEIMAVLGHELGHLKCEHGIWVTLLTALVQVADSFVGSLVPLKTLLLYWQRSAEYSCDRASLLVAKDYKVVASVLMKLCGGSNKNEFSKDLNVEAFPAQAAQLEKEKQSMAGSMYILANEQLSTHPIPLLRATELMRWHRSAQYSGLVRRAVEVKL